MTFFLALQFSSKRMFLARCFVLVGMNLSVCFADEGNQRYKAELPGYKFYQNSAWRSLIPFASTMADVRRLLGRPTRVEDIAHYGIDYPGDAAAKQPVFTYSWNDKWDILIYFVKSGYFERLKFPPSVYDRLYSIDLVAKKPVHFSDSFPAKFKLEHVMAADAAWDEYADESGLRYEIYTSRTPYGERKSGDINRIRYGPTDAEVARYALPMTK
jgi:hypothetical protein